MEITGTVTKIGRVKDYGHDTNFGKDWVRVTKFFMEINSPEQGVINAMVECDAEETEYGFRIPKDSARQKPFIGDTVKISTHRVRENGARWASVTNNQVYEIIQQNEKARQERDDWVQKQKEQRETEFQRQNAQKAQERLQNELEALGVLETEMNDERLPEAVLERMNKTFNWNVIFGLLEHTVWFPGIQEGEGGKICYHNPPCGCGYPGTGLRRPGAPLYNKPATVRTSILTKAMESGIIEKHGNGYRATKLGVKTLAKIDTCQECGEMRRPVSTYSHYSMNYGNGHGWSSTKHLGALWYCTCEIKKALEANRGCNAGTTFKEYKNTQKNIEQINKIIKEE